MTPKTFLEQLEQVVRPADGHGRRADRVLDDQVPANDPGDELAEGRVGIRVGAAGDGNHARQLGIAESGQTAAEPGEKERDNQRRPGVVVGGLAGEDEDPRADRGADAEGRERDRARARDGAARRPSSREAGSRSACGRTGRKVGPSGTPASIVGRRSGGPGYAILHDSSKAERLARPSTSSYNRPRSREPDARSATDGQRLRPRQPSAGRLERPRDETARRERVLPGPRRSDRPRARPAGLARRLSRVRDAGHGLLGPGLRGGRQELPGEPPLEVPRRTDRACGVARPGVLGPDPAVVHVHRRRGHALGLRQSQGEGAGLAVAVRPCDRAVFGADRARQSFSLQTTRGRRTGPSSTS